MTHDQERKLNEVHEAIVGNKELRQKGIIERVESVEVQQEKDKGFRNRITGAVAVGTPLLVAGWHWLCKNVFGL